MELIWHSLAASANGRYLSGGYESCCASRHHNEPAHAS